MQNKYCDNGITNDSTFRLERKLTHKEKEVWDLKEILEETESKLKW